ncbi:hypothetical protein [Nocardia sp. NPDC059691]|uniref:hypothetical protein n=1 Tax=Nocardia sp. NPDC059691 TaxID=3346908 RepID=UPI00368CEFF8
MLPRKVFYDPPTRRDRVRQTDFSEFETTGGGIWRICAVIDYATKYCLAITITPTARSATPLACLQLAVTEAESTLGLQDLRADRGLAEVIGPAGELLGMAPIPIAVVSDNGPCFRGGGVQVRVRRAGPAAAARSHPGPITTDQRCDRAGLQHLEIRAPVPRRHRRR